MLALNGAAQALGKLRSAIQGGAWQQYHELLATVATGKIGFTNQLRGDARCFADHLVPGLVAIGVVDPFEMVDVKDHQADRIVVTLMACKLSFQAGFPVPAIEQAGQAVTQGQFLQLSIGRLQLPFVYSNAGDIINNQADMVGFAGAAAQGQDGDVLVHLVSHAGDRLIAFKVHQVGPLLPDGEGAGAQHYRGFYLVGKPALVNLGEQGKQRLPCGLVSADPGVVFHEAVPDLDVVVAVHDHHADINALHDVEQPVEFVDIDVFGHL